MRHDEQVTNEHPEAVRSAPVPVPPPGDRSGRGDRSEVPEDAIDDRGTFDDPAVADERADSDRDGRADADPDRTRPHDVRADSDGDGRPEFHEPGPVPTAFGATTVGGAVAASALASPLPEDEPDPRLESTARPGDGAVDGAREGRRADPTAEFGHGDRDRHDDSAGNTDRGDADRADDDRRAGAAGTLPTDATDGRPERRDDLTTWAGDPDAARAGAVGYGSADPTLVDPDARPSDAGAGTRDAGAGVAAAGAAGAAAAGSLGAEGTTPPAGSTVAAEPATLFDAETAQGFRDRWRDVQLRFVDDPKAAAGEAQSLVDEAIQALASALSAQKQKLGGWQDAGSADTEQLRMAVRQYRDFLDRVLGR
ncbi:hypothetical protein [Micromonospora endolithica]|uniref:Uncharacterized protein n=1 Tax=Micromonospora endolithica TaxID=230091 RepID=A0A3A9Z139_9ACTN|nr:hypothetical protein [Micromonospora endolithica]RKN42023.1 hypothetical protein D7223_23030 [Micromonospora endolithica]TWJ26256.1 hypothetical protein JD76_06437 [Micromonospora endolithica]